MNGGTLSGGVVIALAAVLWLAYLVPTWLRRRDYLNAERNAVRLQQTLRILAQTAEAPEEVRVEATARDVARQQKLLKKARANADAAARAHAQSEARAAARLAAERAAQPAPQTVSPPRANASGGQAPAGQLLARQAPVPTSLAKPRATRAEREHAFAHAVRRSRLVTLGALVASLIGLGFGAYSAAAAGSWWVLVASAALFVGAIAVLRRLAQQVAAHRAARPAQVATVRADPELFDHSLEGEPPARMAPAQAKWEPQPLPKPLYQSPGSRAAAAMASLDAAVALRRAAARAELEARATAIARAAVPTLPRREEAAQASETATAVVSEVTETKAASRFARMGLLDGVESEHIDLDEALRRRRVAG